MNGLPSYVSIFAQGLAIVCVAMLVVGCKWVVDAYRRPR